MSKFRPSLKICIDNTQGAEQESGSSDSEAEDGELGSSSSSSSGSGSESSGSESGSNSGSSSSDEESAASDDTLTANRKRKRALPSKPQHIIKEATKKKDEKSKKFGIWHNKKGDAADLAPVFKSLGVTEVDLNGGPRGIRLEAVHVRGVQDMSTEDVLNYFKSYSPSSVEWIDDLSCNVVWLDSVSAGHALLKKTKDYEELRKSHQKAREQKAKEKERREKEKKEKRLQKEKPKPELDTASAPIVDIEMEDDDILDLLADDDIDAKPEEKNPELPPITAKPEEDTSASKSPEDKMDTEDEESETGSISDSDDELPECPPGKWRLGDECPKAKTIFLRYAFKADRKRPGAERRSKHYEKFENPNFPGVRGIISNSRKRKMQYERQQEEMADGKRSSKGQALRRGVVDTAFDLHTREAPRNELLHNRLQPEVANDDMFGDLSSLETFAVDVRGPKEKTRPSFITNSDHEDGAGNSRGESQDRSPAYSPQPSPSKHASDDDMDVEKELQELLAPPPPKRLMRMYADDVDDQKNEEASKAQSKEIFGHLDARSKIENRRKQKKMGLLREEPAALSHDLRHRLGSKVSGKRERKPEFLAPVEKLTVQLFND